MRKLRTWVKVCLVILFIGVLVGIVLVFCSHESVEKQEENKFLEKVDYVSIVSKKLDDIDLDFIKWVDKNYKGSIEKLNDELEKIDYDVSLWHKVTGNSYIVLNDLYNDLYKNMNNVTVIDGHKDNSILSFVGDVSLADNWHVMPKYDERGKGVYGILAEELVNEMKASDICVANSEFSVSDRGTPMKGKMFTFRGSPNRISIYNEMGVNLVTLANNHVYDFGSDAFLDTLDSFDKAKMPRIGAGRNLSEASKPYYYVVNGYKFAFLNSTRAEKNILTPGATNDSEGVFRSYDPSGMVDKIKEIRENVDFLITIVHFGKEGSHSLEKEQVESAKMFIDAGSDAVVGHHAHVLQGFEFYQDKLIAYNLGNFIFNDKTLDTMIFQIMVDNDGIFSYKVIPALQSGVYTNILFDSEKQRVIDELNSWSINANVDEQGNVLKIS